MVANTHEVWLCAGEQVQKERLASQPPPRVSALGIINLERKATVCDGDHIVSRLPVATMFLEGLRLLGNPAECSVEPMSVFLRVFWPQALVLLALVLTVMWMGVWRYGAVSLTELAYGTARRLPRRSRMEVDDGPRHGRHLR